MLRRSFSKILTSAHAALRAKPPSSHPFVQRWQSATSSEPSHSQTNPPPRWVRQLNESIERYPLETLTGYIAGDIGSIALTYGIVMLLGIDGSADLAAALALSRLFRRLRFPLDLAVAAGLAKLYPPLSQVHVSRMLGSVVLLDPQPLPQAPPHSFPMLKARAHNALVVMLRLADEYGLAYKVSQRMVVGVVSVCSFYTLLRWGVDVQARGAPPRGQLESLACRG
jgi:hypothetical protein